AHLHEMQISVSLTDDDEGRAEAALGLGRAAFDVDIEEYGLVIGLGDGRGRGIVLPIAGREDAEAALDARRRREAPLERTALRVGAFGRHQECRGNDEKARDTVVHRSACRAPSSPYLARKPGILQRMRAN